MSVESKSQIGLYLLLLVSIVVFMKQILANLGYTIYMGMCKLVPI